MDGEQVIQVFADRDRTDSDIYIADLIFTGCILKHLGNAAWLFPWVPTLGRDLSCADERLALDFALPTFPLE